MKHKIQFDYNPKGDTLAEVFGVSEERAGKIGLFIDKLVQGKSTPRGLMTKCLEEYEDIELLIAICMVWNICMIDATIQQEIAEQIALARVGIRMPKEMQ